MSGKATDAVRENAAGNCLITEGTTWAGGRRWRRSTSARRISLHRKKQRTPPARPVGLGTAPAFRGAERPGGRAGVKGPSWTWTVESPARRLRGPGRAGAQRRPRPHSTSAAPRLASPRLLTLRQCRAAPALGGSGTSRPEGRCAAGSGRAGVGRLRGVAGAGRARAAAGARRGGGWLLRGSEAAGRCRALPPGGVPVAGPAAAGRLDVLARWRARALLSAGVRPSPSAQLGGRYEVSLIKAGSRSPLLLCLVLGLVCGYWDGGKRSIVKWETAQVLNGPECLQYLLLILIHVVY